MESQVHPARRDEVDLAELPGIDQSLDRSNGWAVEEGVTGHQDEAFGLGQRSQLEHLIGCRSERLLDENMLSGLERRLRERVVRRNRRRDRNRVYRSVRKDLFEACRPGNARIARRQHLQHVWPKIAETAELELLRIGEVPNEIRAPVPETDHADADAVPARRVGPALR